MDVALLQEFVDATTLFTTYAPTGNADLDYRMAERLYRAETEIERLGLRGTPAYAAAVFQAEQNANVLRSRWLS
jgi:hypothetical protein